MTLPKLELVYCGYVLYLLHDSYIMEGRVEISVDRMENKVYSFAGRSVGGKVGHMHDRYCDW